MTTSIRHNCRIFLKVNVDYTTKDIEIGSSWEVSPFIRDEGFAMNWKGYAQEYAPQINKGKKYEEQARPF